MVQEFRVSNIGALTHGPSIHLLDGERRGPQNMQCEGHVEWAILRGVVRDRASQDHFTRRGQGSQTMVPTYSLPLVSGWAPCYSAKPNQKAGSMIPSMRHIGQAPKAEIRVEEGEERT